MEEQPPPQKTVKETLDAALFLAERTRKASMEADSFKQECREVARLVDSLSQMLLSSARLPVVAVCERPTRRIVTEVIKNLDRALSLVKKCRRSGVLKRLITITNATDFRRLFALLDNSNGDMKWLLNVSGLSAGFALSMPPIASTDPILSWVWSYIALVQNGSMADRIEAANGLASLAADNARNGKIIIEEGGVAPLLKLLKDGSAIPDVQLAAGKAMASLATDSRRVAQISEERAVPAIVHCLTTSPPAVQTVVASLVGEMARHDPLSREEFARENAIRPLVALLSSGIIDDVSKSSNHHSASVQSNIKESKGMAGRSPEKAELLANSSRALWMLAKGSVENSRRITETRGLVCLAKIIAKEQGDFQYNCLMAVGEIAAVAEANAELRRAFRTNSSATKEVVDQLIRLTKESNSLLQIPAMRSLGCLSRMFSARETRVLWPIVDKLDHRDSGVASEAAAALAKFTNPENFLCVEHAKSIIDFGGVPPLMRLLTSGEGVQLSPVILLCYLAIHVSGSEELKQARALVALQLQLSHHPSYKEFIQRAIYQLELYQAGHENHIHMHDR